jgi:hypothetical protein
LADSSVRVGHVKFNFRLDIFSDRKQPPDEYRF